MSTNNSIRDGLETAFDWKKETRDMLESLIIQYELPAESIYLSDNIGQKTVSHSVYIWEPDYPPLKDKKRGQNKNVLTISEKSKKGMQYLEFSIRETQEGDLREFLPKNAELLKQTEADLMAKSIRIRMDNATPGLVDYIKRHTEYCIQNYESKEARFGCCSSFERCSDARRCVHENKLYSKACIYRESLDQGKIFYGKNRNVV